MNYQNSRDNSERPRSIFDSTIEERQFNELEANKQRKFLWFNKTSSTEFINVETKMRNLVNHLNNESTFDFLRLIRRDYGGLLETESAERACDIINRTIDGQFSTHFNLLCNFYHAAIEACKTYLSKNKGFKFTSSGRSRYRIISELHDRLTFEKTSLEHNKSIILQRCFYVDVPNSIADKYKSWRDVISELRREYIDITDRSDISSTGGACSHVTVIGKDENQSFFKPEEFNKPVMLADVLSCTKYGPIQQIISRVYSEIQPGDNPQETPITNMKVFILRCIKVCRDTLTNGCENPRYKSFIDRYGKKFTSANVLERAKVTRDGREISSRNVATYRLGRLLGSEDLFVETKKARIKNGNKVTKGIVMSRAKGQNISSLIDSINSAKHIFENELWIGFSANAQKQFCSLQAIDCLTGQVDRHFGNYLIDYTVGYDESQGAENLRLNIKSIQGIDNDASFGNLKFGDMKKIMENLFNAHIYKKTVPTDIIPVSLPLIDKSLFEAIVANAENPSIINYYLMDLLANDEIESTNNRFTDFVNFVESSNVQIVNEWNNQTLRSLINSSETNYLKAFRDLLIKMCKTYAGIINIHIESVGD